MNPQISFGLIDSHAHIQGSEFSTDLEGVVDRACKAGVDKIVVVGGAGDLSSNLAALELAQSFAALYATVGMHPHDAKEVTEEDFHKLQDLTAHPKVVAVGETGLDFYYDHSPRRLQMEMFSRFVNVAKETELPLVVHDRDAHREVEEVLRREGNGRVRGVIHCFTGDYGDAKAFLDMGFYISFTGIITFRNAEPLRDVVRRLPVERLLIETDSPYLAPVPFRGRRNEPAFVRFVAETVARVKGLSLERVAAVTTQNAQDLFRI